MAKLMQKFVSNEIIALVNPTEVIIARFNTMNPDGSMSVMDPHVIITQQSPQGMRIGFVKYNEGCFVIARNMRDFDPANFVTIDLASAEISDHFKNAMSPIKAPPKSKLIGL